MSVQPRISDSSQRSSGIAAIFAPIAVLVTVLMVWQLLVVRLKISPVILPGPIGVMEAVVRIRGELLMSSGRTALAALTGLLASTVLGTLIAFLFSQSLKDSIIFGIDKFSMDEVLNAATIAGIKEEIDEFPNGFDTIIGERGVTLSGGQKQRVSLARAIIGKPPVLILDDAFSAVDTNTEELILNRLKNVLETHTSIIISHRISTIKHADMICVMENGQIMATGTHDELLQKSELYAHIVRLQSLEEELEVIQ